MKKARNKFISILLMLSILITSFIFIRPISNAIEPGSILYTTLKTLHLNNPAWDYTAYYNRMQKIASSTGISPILESKWINPYVYDNYNNLVVYGVPSGLFTAMTDGKMKKDGIQGEYQYLGYNDSSELVTNDRYHKVNANSTFTTVADYKNADWIMQELNLRGSWNGLRSEQRNHLLNSSFYDDDYSGTPAHRPPTTLSTFLAGKTISDYAYVQVAPKAFVGGSVNLKLRKPSGSLSWNSLIYEPLNPDFNLNASMITDKDTYYISALDDSVTVKASMTGKVINCTLKLMKTMDFNFYSQNKSKLIGTSDTHVADFDKIFTRSNLKVGNNTVELSGNISVTTQLNDPPKSQTAKKTITIIVEEPAEPRVICDLSASPKKIKFSGTNVSQGFTVDYGLMGLKNQSLISDITVFLYPEEYSSINTDYPEKALTGSITFDLVLPAKELNRSELTFTASVIYTMEDGNKYSASDTVILPINEDEDETGTDGNNPPTLEIYTEEEVRPGEHFSAFLSGSDEDGDELIYTLYKGVAEIVHLNPDNTYATLYYPAKYAKSTVNLHGDVTDGIDKARAVARIRVLPADPEAKLTVSGALKVNRKVDFINASVGTDEYPIVSKTLTITPLTAGITASDIKYIGSLSDDDITESVLFKKAGNYKASLTVTNTAGYSASDERVFTIAPDLAPIANFAAASIIYRSPTNNNKATFELFNISYSPDNDYISNIKIYTRFDTDNDGNFNEHEWTLKYNGVSQNSVTADFTSVGKYQARIVITEGYGQPTIPELLTSTDYLAAETQRTFEIQNIAPSLDFSMQAQPKGEVNLHFIVNEGLKSSLNSSITHLRDSLANKDITANIQIDEIPDQGTLTETFYRNLNSISGSETVELIIGDRIISSIWNSDALTTTLKIEDFYGEFTKTLVINDRIRPKYIEFSIAGTNTIAIDEDNKTLYCIGSGTYEALNIYAIDLNTGTLKYTFSKDVLAQRPGSDYFDFIINPAIEDGAINIQYLIVDSFKNADSKYYLQHLSINATTGVEVGSVDLGQVMWEGGFTSRETRAYSIDYMQGGKTFLGYSQKYKRLYYYDPDGQQNSDTTRNKPSIHTYQVSDSGAKTYLSSVLIPNKLATDGKWSSNYDFGACGAQVLSGIFDSCLYFELSHDYKGKYNDCYIAKYNIETNELVMGQYSKPDDRVFRFLRPQDSINRYDKYFSLYYEEDDGNDDFYYTKLMDKNSMQIVNTISGSSLFQSSVHSDEYDYYNQNVYKNNTLVASNVTHGGMYSNDMGFVVRPNPSDTSKMAIYKIRTPRSSVVIDKLNKYTPTDVEDPTYVIPMLNQSLYPEGAEKANEILTEKGYKVLFFAGFNSSVVSYMDKLMNGLNGLMFSLLADMEANLNNIANNISLPKKQHVPVTEYIVAGDTITFESAYSDFESDPINAMSVLYQHDPSVFENHQGMDPNSGVTLSTFPTKFDKVGLYTLTAKAQDKPSTSSALASYNLWSEPAQKNIYVHRRPIAEFDFSYSYDGNCYALAYTESSYDLDHLSLSNRGIVQKVWSYKYANDLHTDWNTGQLTKALIDKDYYIRLEVMDMEYEWGSKVLSFNIQGNGDITINPASRDWANTPVTAAITYSKPIFLSKLKVQSTTSDNPPNEGWIETTSSTASKTISAEGIHYIHAQALETTGSIAGALGGPYKIDLTPPLITADKASGSYMPSVQVKITATDVLSGFHYMSYVWSTSTTTPSTGWNTSYNATTTTAKNTPGTFYLYVKACDKATNVSTVKRFGPYTVITNQPPIITIAGTTPSFIYEGDDVNINFLATDPDLNALTCTITIKKTGTTVWTGSKTVTPSSGTYSVVSLPTLQNSSSGSYTVEIRATDPGGLSDVEAMNFTVHVLGITGAVSHTAKWEENRMKYNQAAALAARAVRTPSVFFPGEKFMLQAETTVIDAGSGVMANSVTVKIQGTTLLASLLKKDSSTFQGFLWHNDMIRWNNGPLDFIFTATYSNGAVKIDTVRVNIVDDEYWRLHLTF